MFWNLGISFGSLFWKLLETILCMHIDNNYPVKSGFEENPASLTFVVTHCCCCSGSPEIRTKRRV